jgi:hypothetical protein
MHGVEGGGEPCKEEPSKGELEETAAELLLWMSDKSYSTNIHFSFHTLFFSTFFFSLHFLNQMAITHVPLR